MDLKIKLITKLYQLLLRTSTKSFYLTLKGLSKGRLLALGLLYFLSSSVKRGMPVTTVIILLKSLKFLHGHELDTWHFVIVMRQGIYIFIRSTQ